MLSLLLMSSITSYRSVRIKFFTIELFYYLSIRFFRMRVSKKKKKWRKKQKRDEAYIVAITSNVLLIVIDFLFLFVCSRRKKVIGVPQRHILRVHSISSNISCLSRCVWKIISLKLLKIQFHSHRSLEIVVVVNTLFVNPEFYTFFYDVTFFSSKTF